MLILLHTVLFSGPLDWTRGTGHWLGELDRAIDTNLALFFHTDGKFNKHSAHNTVLTATLQSSSGHGFLYLSMPYLSLP